MLVEKTMEETIKAFLNGNKKTMIAVRMEDGSMWFVHLTSLLPADGVYFINVEPESGEDYEEKVLRNGQGGIPLQQIRLLVKTGEQKKKMPRR
ncbi:hypothetical protein D3Z53_23205 [Lachnospiraceae bacterium]|nr:hypothetical protein [uncultured Schaedlerella sp.]MCI9153816.1 hypothetical protein [Ruminococcus sp.]NBI60868.1 hypothetical protein [Lachnospiraceae bacterium]